MNINLIQNIVCAILLAYFIVVLFKSVFRALECLITKINLFVKSKKFMKNVDAEYTDYLKEKDNVK